jgi:hypothetical protein
MPTGQELTRDQAQDAFNAVAALRDEIAFRWLAEGCECRTQLMIEHLLVLGLEPGRAWAISVGRPLSFPQPGNPRRRYKWANHVAPTVPVAGAAYGVLVIDPSLCPDGPCPLMDWAALLGAQSVEVAVVGLLQADILQRQAARALQGMDLDTVVFSLRLGEAPLPEVGGSGFRIDADPPEGPSEFARKEMRVYLANEKKLLPPPA